ncbi:MAG: acetamidase/formamidase family protein [bacterium]
MAVHTFKPEIYYNTLGTHEPVLKIADGDTVITTTLDNAGRDASDIRVTEGINPQTGPFYIENAEPGDILAITLDKLWPNRTIGRSSYTIAPNVIDPDYVIKLSRENMNAEWKLDLDKGEAWLVKPETNLKHFCLKFSPMLGCFGVAPPMGQAIASTTAANHGGNMDYKGFVAGVTIYFPVFVSGALFFLGDGHAVQGDGEISGTGIEVSFDVQFTVKVIKGKSIKSPRAENHEYIMTVGNARPLDQALQNATTEMIKWLKEDLDISDSEIGILLGQCIEYDIGNVYDPAYTIVSKLSKRFLDVS